MKKISVFFASAACLFAVVGVFAKTTPSRLALVSTFYVPGESNYTTLAPSCVYTIPAVCPPGFVTRCTWDYNYGVPIGLQNVKVSKRVDGGTCVAAYRN